MRGGGGGLQDECEPIRHACFHESFGFSIFPPRLCWIKLPFSPNEMTQCLYTIHIKYSTYFPYIPRDTTQFIGSTLSLSHASEIFFFSCLLFNFVDYLISFPGIRIFSFECEYNITILGMLHFGWMWLPIFFMTFSFKFFVCVSLNCFVSLLWDISSFSLIPSTWNSTFNENK